eukprot:ANDGO_03280.mRNA.1 hypothetical protein
MAAFHNPYPNRFSSVQTLQSACSSTNTCFPHSHQSSDSSTRDSANYPLSRPPASTASPTPTSSAFRATSSRFRINTVASEFVPDREFQSPSLPPSLSLAQSARSPACSCNSHDHFNRPRTASISTSTMQTSYGMSLNAVSFVHYHPQMGVFSNSSNAYGGVVSVSAQAPFTPYAPINMDVGGTYAASRHSAGHSRVLVVDTLEAARDAIGALWHCSMLAVDCEGVTLGKPNGSLCTIQITPIHSVFEMQHLLSMEQRADSFTFDRATETDEYTDETDMDSCSSDGASPAMSVPPSTHDMEPTLNSSRTASSEDAYLSCDNSAFLTPVKSEHCAFASETPSSVSTDHKGVTAFFPESPSGYPMRNEASAPAVYVFDILALGRAVFQMGLADILESEDVTKVVFDCRGDSYVLFDEFEVVLRGVLDLQLLEVASRRARGFSVRYVSGLARCMESARLWTPAEVAEKHRMHEAFRSIPTGWCIRPIPEDWLEYAVRDVKRLSLLKDHLEAAFDASQADGWLERVRCASAMYAETGRFLTSVPEAQFHALARDMTRAIDF